MMNFVTFSDGPGTGSPLELARAPTFLRVVVAPDGTVDALDQLDDKPNLDETIYAYRLFGKPGRLHIDRTNPKTRRREGLWYRTARYQLCAVQPGDEVLRDCQRWQAWCVEQAAKEKANV